MVLRLARLVVHGFGRGLRAPSAAHRRRHGARVVSLLRRALGEAAAAAARTCAHSPLQTPPAGRPRRQGRDVRSGALPSACRGLAAGRGRRRHQHGGAAAAQQICGLLYDTASHTYSPGSKGWSLYVRRSFGPLDFILRGWAAHQSIKTPHIWSRRLNTGKGQS